MNRRGAGIRTGPGLGGALDSIRMILIPAEAQFGISPDKSFGLSMVSIDAGNQVSISGHAVFTFLASTKMIASDSGIFFGLPSVPRDLSPKPASDLALWAEFLDEGS